MRNNRKMLVCMLAVMGILTIGNPVVNVKENMEMMVMEVNAAETRAYIYEWRYKVIDGHFYKRLFNATTEEWVGDWILIE